MSLADRLFPEKHFIVPAIVACGLFMQNLDTSILSTALPSISRSLDEDPIRLNLAITSYLISLAVFVPISGWVADKFGARRVFQAAIVIFALSSLSCGAANSLLMLVISRVVQGFGGAMMIPVGRLLVLRNVPKSDMVQAMAYLTMPALIGPILGPPLGGFVITIASWRWLFFINIPVGILGIVMTKMFIPNVKETTPPPLDVRGAVLSGVALAALVFGFEIGSRHAMPLSTVLVILAIGAVCAVAYWFHQKRVAHPIIDLSLFSIPATRASLTGGTMFRMGIGSLGFLLPLMLQVGFGYTPLQSGLTTFSTALGSFFMKATAPRFLRRYGFKKVLVWNAVISAALMAAIGLFRVTTPYAIMVACLLVGGFFRSLQFTAANTLGFADVPQNKMSRATSLNSMAQQVAASVGVGLAALLLNLLIALHGEQSVQADDFPPVFLVMAALSFCALWFYLGLPEDAGAEVSGHRRHAAAAPAETPAEVKPGSTR